MIRSWSPASRRRRQLEIIVAPALSTVPRARRLSLCLCLGLLFAGAADAQTPSDPGSIQARPSDQEPITPVLPPPTADPQDPSGVSVDRPSDVLEARAAAKGQLLSPEKAQYSNGAII